MSEEQAKCPDCEGSGRRWRRYFDTGLKRECQTCKGTGRTKDDASLAEQGRVRQQRSGSAAETILRSMGSAGGQATNRDLAVEIGMAAHRVSGHLCRLARLGLVVRLSKGHAGKASEWKLLNAPGERLPGQPKT